MYVCICMYIYTYTYIYVYIDIYICVCVCVYVCVCVCACVCVYVCVCVSVFGMVWLGFVWFNPLRGRMGLRAKSVNTLCNKILFTLNIEKNIPNKMA